MPFTSDGRDWIVEQIISAGPTVGLFTVAPTIAGGGTEVTGGGYAQQSLVAPAPSGGITSSSTIVTFDVPNCTITAAGLWIAFTLVAYGVFSPSVPGLAGVPFQFDLGDIDIVIV